MKRDKNLHPLSWDHHAALTSVVFTRKLIKSGADHERLGMVAEQFATFYQEGLLPHFRHEEEWLIPRYLQHVSHDDPDIIRLLTDHALLHKLILNLAQALATNVELAESLTILTDRLEAHVRFEERELFPKVEAALSVLELQELGASLWADIPESIVIPGSDGCRVKLKMVESAEVE